MTAAAVIVAGCSSPQLPSSVGPVTVRGEGSVVAAADLDGQPVRLSLLVQADRTASPEEQAAGVGWIGRVALRYGVVVVECNRASGQPAECDLRLDLARPEEAPDPKP